MENHNEVLTEKQTEQIIYAAKEESINPENLLWEMKLFLNDYLLGQFKIEDEGMIYEPFNGQKFLVQIKEIA